MLPLYFRFANQGSNFRNAIQTIAMQEAAVIFREMTVRSHGGQLWTVINTPEGVETPSYVAVMGWSPLARDAGSITLN